MVRSGGGPRSFADAPLLVTAALGAPGGTARRSLTPLFDAVLADSLRMRGGRVPWQQGCIVRAAPQQLIEDVFHVEPDVKVVAQRTADERQKTCDPFSARHTAREQPILAAKADLSHQ